MVGPTNILAKEGRLANPSYESWAVAWEAERPSLYDFVHDHLDDEGKFDGPPLPDTEDDGGMRWAPGAFEGVAVHHMATDEDENAVAEVERALRSALEEPSAERRQALYQRLVDVSVLDVVDGLVGRLLEDPPDWNALQQLAGWLMLRAPDRAPVKLGTALLGLFETDLFTPMFATLGRHDEFTLYAAVAIQNGHPHPDPELYELARHVDGWGRIHLVERLVETPDEEIRGWLLREGFRNSVMNEYLAHACARGADLHEAIAADEVDDALMAGTRDILDALQAGGPARALPDYEHGVAVVRRWLELLDGRAPDLRDLAVMIALHRWVQSDLARGEALVALGWTEEVIDEIRTGLEARIHDVQWPDLVTAVLAAPHDPDVPHDPLVSAASRCIGALGIDPFPYDLARAEAGGTLAWRMLKTDDPARMDQVLAVADARFDLAALAQVDPVRGFDSNWYGLGQIITALARFPGRGWPYVRAGLQSRQVRRRRSALETIDAWDRSSWTEDVRDQLVQMAATDPEAAVRRDAEDLLAGRTLQGEEE